MRKLFGLLLIVFALPVFASLSTHSRRQAQAFNAVAVAGHTQSGGAYCTCGCGDGCICDPGEVPMECNRATPQPGSDKVDLGSGILIFALALFVAYRFK